MRWRSYDPAGLVTIVLPVHNGDKYLSLSIESCLAQTHQHFELIIVDDGSTDNTAHIITKYAVSHHRIKHLTNRTILDFLNPSM
jgi:glycosyltransferase involved in cell wall biosynthesis